MKHNAAWFFNFFNNLHNWTTGCRYNDGSYCAIGHLQSFEGKSDKELSDKHALSSAYYTPLVKECADVVFEGRIRSIWKINDRYSREGPKVNILKVCRLAILRENPECELGKEYDA